VTATAAVYMSNGGPTYRTRSLHEEPLVQTVDVVQVTAPRATDVGDSLRGRDRVAAASRRQ
jgi:hypothetical protein